MRTVRRCLSTVARRTPFLKEAIAERDHLRAARGCFPLGHFHSPVPSRDDVNERTHHFYEQRKQKEILGVDLNEHEQLWRFDQLAVFYDDLPFTGPSRDQCRYSPDSTSYNLTDAIFLYGMIRHLRPRRIIEAGCGNSSCVILDTNEMFFDNEIACTFIDPYPDRLLASITKDDRSRSEVVTRPMQDVAPARFSALERDDILFIDSSHVCKLGSDVNYIFFEILPRLQSGVFVHFHDIFYPFGYTRSWLDKGVFFNEAYLLKAFLQYNETFKISLFYEFLHLFHQEKLAERMPLCAHDRGASIWLRRA